MTATTPIIEAKDSWEGSNMVQTVIPEPNALTLGAIRDSYGNRHIGRADSVAAMLDYFEKEDI